MSNPSKPFFREARLFGHALIQLQAPAVHPQRYGELTVLTRPYKAFLVEDRVTPTALETLAAALEAFAASHMDAAGIRLGSLRIDLTDNQLSGMATLRVRRTTRRDFACPWEVIPTLVGMLRDGATYLRS